MHSRRTRVKICGLTRTEDVQTAVAAGADAIGLVFYEPSPRYVTAEQASELARAAGPFVTTVGLFVNASEQAVRDVLAQVSLDLLQFHGEESAAFCESFERPYIKAVRVAGTNDISDAAANYASARGLLLDTYEKGKPGGTGKSFNWSLIPEQVSQPIILAGGLAADNVASAIKQVQPYAVDVSGGVEETKGIKSPEKIHQFMQEVAAVGQ